ncbi:hypothetical protein PC116_g8988 [Phytophthora cactorum]|nr:hypothetical protein PC120_g4677 [Phytophthora cactorum]KAG3180863.1 hypothetical protein C6341_g6705 [Phytophthora cactorum]KAG3203380.1 hypothetical protein PC128_g2615 [Phytophthora cactorum]KAG4060214.1 hypothetical protein PC123_g4877 [Phytophthora cactorum]KAG4243154.1 hypothetical protein PC116_g8988 [Phytophthora cactorum]
MDPPSHFRDCCALVTSVRNGFTSLGLIRCILPTRRASCPRAVPYHDGDFHAVFNGGSANKANADAGSKLTKRAS